MLCPLPNMLTLIHLFIWEYSLLRYLTRASSIWGFCRVKRRDTFEGKEAEHLFEITLFNWFDYLYSNNLPIMLVLLSKSLAPRILSIMPHLIAWLILGLKKDMHRKAYTISLPSKSTLFDFPWGTQALWLVWTNRTKKFF